MRPGGGGWGAFPPANDSAQVRLRAAEHSDWMLSRPDKVTNVDIVQRKRNIALVSGQSLFQCKSESWFGFQLFWSTEREAGKSDAELGYFVMDR